MDGLGEAVARKKIRTKNNISPSIHARLAVVPIIPRCSAIGSFALMSSHPLPRIHRTNSIVIHSSIHRGSFGADVRFNCHLAGWEISLLSYSTSLIVPRLIASLVAPWRARYFSATSKRYRGLLKDFGFSRRTKWSHHESLRRAHAGFGGRASLAFMSSLGRREEGMAR
jgi:hypothetical protein